MENGFQTQEIKPLRDSVWVKGNALIVAGVRGHSRKCPRRPFARFWGASKSGIALLSKNKKIH
jgi:hypothetical protein